MENKMAISTLLQGSQEKIKYHSKLLKTSIIAYSDSRTHPQH